MTLVNPNFGQRTKFCFVYCGDDRCNCGAKLLSHPHPQGGVPKPAPIKDPFDEAMDVNQFLKT